MISMSKEFSSQIVFEANFPVTVLAHTALLHIILPTFSYNQEHMAVFGWPEFSQLVISI